ncbi:hypothetical protein FJTKL_09495 [Diaporthe vaccinii]|uniref:Uncharacterized protein n=1 Tax=Diaporthe vaccinii TaxID=105482 RepID=A0ABR4FCX7_9PEZI
MATTSFLHGGHEKHKLRAPRRASEPLPARGRRFNSIGSTPTTAGREHSPSSCCFKTTMAGNIIITA